MSEQSNNVYYQNTDPTVKSAPADPAQVHFYPYGAPAAERQPNLYPQVEGAYIQPPLPPPPPYPNTWGTMPANQFTDRIRDYMPWSIINICIGGVFLGLIAVLFSYITIRRKQKNNVQAAQRWSKITLIYNVLVDLAVIALIIILIIVYATRKRNTYTYPY